MQWTQSQPPAFCEFIFCITGIQRPKDSTIFMCKVVWYISIKRSTKASCTTVVITRNNHFHISIIPIPKPMICLEFDTGSRGKWYLQWDELNNNSWGFRKLCFIVVKHFGSVQLKTAVITPDKAPIYTSEHNFLLTRHPRMLPFSIIRVRTGAGHARMPVLNLKRLHHDLPILWHLNFPIWISILLAITSACIASYSEITIAAIGLCSFLSVSERE